MRATGVAGSKVMQFCESPRATITVGAVFAGSTVVPAVAALPSDAGVFVANNPAGGAEATQQQSS